MPQPKGRVILVGAGPGAADLLTLRAIRALNSADVVVHDALVGEDTLALIPAGVRRIDVGKRGFCASAPQAFINRLMVKLAVAGARVVRLKGGDPSILARGAEERDHLEAAGIEVEVIPGVTAASAAAAQFGFSLTRRGVARQVVFTTGRTADDIARNASIALDGETTLCLYMAGAEISAIANRLMASGASGATPVAAMIDVERPGARLIRCRLEEAATNISRRSGDGPMLIIVGEVARDARDAAHALANAERSTLAHERLVG